jgi:hypothetical protein
MAAIGACAALSACLSPVDPAALGFACTESSQCRSGHVCAPVGDAQLCVAADDAEVETGETSDTPATGGDADVSDLAAGDDGDLADTSSADVVIASCPSPVRDERLLGDRHYILPCGEALLSHEDARAVCGTFSGVGSVWKVAAVQDLIAFDSCNWVPGSNCNEGCAVKAACACAYSASCEARDDFPPGCGPYWVDPLVGGGCLLNAYDFRAGHAVQLEPGATAFVLCAIFNEQP